MSPDLDAIAARLAASPPESLQGDGRTRAAVAMIVRQGAGGLEVLLIQRAPHNLDPWSGHLAFPGGKVEQGENPRQAAERETLEEVGIDLAQATYLGALGEISGMTLPVRVSCYLFLLGSSDCRPVLNEEVSDAFWVSLGDLMAAERQISATVHFDGGAHQVPAIQLPRDGIPVLWGLTYRMVRNFIGLCMLQQDECRTGTCG